MVVFHSANGIVTIEYSHLKIYIVALYKASALLNLKTAKMKILLISSIKYLIILMSICLLLFISVKTVKQKL